MYCCNICVVFACFCVFFFFCFNCTTRQGLCVWGKRGCLESLCDISLKFSGTFLNVYMLCLLVCLFFVCTKHHLMSVCLSLSVSFSLSLPLSSLSFSLFLSFLSLSLSLSLSHVWVKWHDIMLVNLDMDVFYMMCNFLIFTLLAYIF